MQDGYVKLWRKSISSSVFCNADLWQLWTWCLMRAAHKKRFVTVTTGRGESIVEILPGQFIFGRKSCAKELNSNESSIRNRIKKLEKLSVLMVKPDTHFSIVSICNWEHYQVDEKENNQPKDTQRTGKGQPKDTNKNVKNVKNKDIYGIGENVLLTRDEHEKLKNKLGHQCDIYIDKLSTYDKIAKYKNHYLTILGWWAKDEEKRQETTTQYKRLN